MINSVILAASALLLRETQFVIGWEALIIIPLLVAGVIASLQWMSLIPVYEILVNVRVHTLEQMEARTAIQSRTLSLFRREFEALRRERNAEAGNLYRSLHGFARYLSRVLATLRN